MTTVNSKIAPTPPARGPDDDLVARAVAGDKQALADLLPRLRDDAHAVIRRTSRRAGGTGTDEDVYQDGVGRICEEIESFELRSSPFAQFRGWALRITRNLASDRLRRKKTKKEVELHADVQFVDPRVEDPAVLAETDDQISRMLVALGELEPHERELIRLYYCDGFTGPQIRERFNCDGRRRAEDGKPPTLNAIYARVRRALEKIREKLIGGGR